MGSSSILFIGYSLKDYNLRLLLRALAWSKHAVDVKPSYSVDPAPDNVVALVQESGTAKLKIIFIEEDLWDVVPELYRTCTGREYDGEAQ